MKSSHRKCRRFGKVLLWVFGILIVLRIVIPIVGVAVANRALPGILGTKTSMGGVDMVLLRGRLSVADISIKQPEGFGEGDLFSLGKATVDLNIPSAFKSPITVDSITIDNLALNVIRNTNGVMNVDTLAGDASTNAVPEKESATIQPPAVTAKIFNVRNLSISYRDLTYDPPLVAHITECNIFATNIVFDPAPETEEFFGSLILTALLKQADMHDAHLGIVSQLGAIGTNVPAVVAVAAAVRLVGVELKPLSGVVPIGVSQILGGSCVDAYVDLTMAEHILDCKARVKTEDNTAVFAVGGTPSNPKINVSTALFNLIGRPGALVGGIATDLGSAGIEVAGAAAKTTAAVGLGAIKMVGSLGKGVLQTAKGIATADLTEIGEGLKTATVGTVTEGINTAVDTAITVGEGIGDTASATIGKGDTDEWRANCEPRWDAIWQKAQQDVHAAPYPRPKAEPHTEEDATANEPPPTPPADAVADTADETNAPPVTTD